MVLGSSRLIEGEVVNKSSSKVVAVGLVSSSSGDELGSDFLVRESVLSTAVHAEVGSAEESHDSSLVGGGPGLAHHWNSGTDVYEGYNLGADTLDCSTVINTIDLEGSIENLTEREKGVNKY